MEKNPKLPTKLTTSVSTTSTVLVYNFQSMFSYERFILFTILNSSDFSYSKVLKNNTSVDPVTELYYAANWLEREAAELHGINFFGKKDLRNLMLQYGDSTEPLKKSFPSIGLKEIFYSPLKDTLVQNPVSLQL